tara:strand:+ start:72 stop:803 length:732 start_codon:yes stop_codon:yes gene_type:complete
MIEEILRKRKNLNFFRDDKVPDKKVIEDILQKTHESLPTKNNLNAYEVEVYGPEHYDEKKLVALSSVCSTAGKPFTKSNKHEDFKKLEELYDLWIESHKQKRKLSEELNNLHFNNQVRAPYLLVYTQRENILTDTQKESDFFKEGGLENIFKPDVNKDNGMWLIQSGMHGILTTAFAIEKGLDASFCKCYFYNNYMHTNILRKAYKSSKNIAFLLGLGYRDDTKPIYETKITKAKIDEVVKWV